MADKPKARVVSMSEVAKSPGLRLDAGYYLKPKVIKDLDELKTLALGRDLECFIALNGGAKSSKTIRFYDSGAWTVFNAIDGTSVQCMDLADLQTKTNVIAALDKGALYREV